MRDLTRLDIADNSFYFSNDISIDKFDFNPLRKLLQRYIFVLRFFEDYAGNEGYDGIPEFLGKVLTVRLGRTSLMNVV